jgi:LmbE family N-acetylglucosaminyl deacetylase
MLLGNIKKALFISAHPDDTEFGAGGLLQILLRKGVDVHLMVLSNPEISMPEGSLENQAVIEQKKSASVLGLKNKICFYDFPVRRFSEHRQDILELLVKTNKEIQPDFVVTHSINDYHQDHNLVAIESIRAFKQQTLLGYTHPWNTRAMVGNIFFELTDEIIKNKIHAISMFESQAIRAYSQPKIIESLALEAGIACGFTYAERFELASMSIKHD